MDANFWTVLSDAERDQWDYVPGQTLGPLRFEMDCNDVVAAMTEHGFANVSEATDAGWHVVEFRKPDGLWAQAAVKCYFDRNRVLAYVLIDGRRGPQVTCEGIRLIGRVPSELAREMETHADKHDRGVRFSYGGDVFCEGFEIELGTQRAGDTVVTWALFFSAGDDHSTARDSAPPQIWHHW
ncbi:hypothetical protein [Streptomyces griseoflavus]|uniref:hypothetical protein n=1 Tax=Streptomyces griseoflavus TaxID=35619 RepID=UPI001E28BF43|nr:hypothetical protein [Streptomyces griseoflavus]